MNNFVTTTQNTNANLNNKGLQATEKGRTGALAGMQVALANRAISQEENASKVPENNNIFDKALYVTKKGGAGLLTGTVGIGQAALTDVASNIEKGSLKNIDNLLVDSTKSVTLNPMINMAFKSHEESLNLLNDKTKSPFEKLVQLVLNGSSNALDYMIPGKPAFDSAMQILGKLNPEAKDSVMGINDAITKPVDEINASLAKEGESYDKFTQLLGNANHSIGNMLPSIAASTVTKNPTIGLSVMAMSAKGQATQEALNNGASLEQAKKIGDTKMWIEVATEKMTGGLNHFGDGFLDSFVESNLSKIKNDILRKFVEKGLLEPAEEITEETISDILGYFIDKGTVNPNAEYTWEDWLDTVTTTALSTYGLNTINSGLEKISKKNANKNTNENKNNSNVKTNFSDARLFFEAKFSPDGNIEQIHQVAGQKIDNPNKAVNISPVITINEQTDSYNVIDGNTGMILDDTSYETVIGAKTSFNEKMNKLSKGEINNINNKNQQINTSITKKM